MLTETTAELAASLTFAAARRVVEADRYMRKGLYLGWAPTLMVGQLLQVRQLHALLASSSGARGQRSSAGMGTRTMQCDAWLRHVVAQRLK